MAQLFSLGISTVMKSKALFVIVFAVFFIAACSMQGTLNDTQIRKQIVGAWVASESKQFSVRFESSGTYSAHDERMWATGTWSIQDGVITVSTLKSSLTNTIPVEKAQVIRMDRHELAFRQIGETNLCVFTRD